MANRIGREKNLLAMKGNRLIRVLTMTATGAIAQFEYMDDKGNIYMPQIVNGKNVEEFKIVGEQTSLL